MPVVADGDLCGCGRRGCLETVASGRAVAERGRGLAARGEATALLECVNGRVEDITVREVFGTAAAGAALLDPLRAALRASAWTAAAEAVRIVPAALGTQAGAIGAALFVAEALRGC